MTAVAKAPLHRAASASVIVFCFALVFDLVLHWATVVQLVLVVFDIGHADDHGYLGDEQFDNMEEDDQNTTLLLILACVKAGHILLLYGAVASQLPKKQVSGALDNNGGRSSRMNAQGGHSLMLAYFVGLGPIAELVRGQCTASEQALTNLHLAAAFQATYLCTVMGVLHAVELYLRHSTACTLALVSSVVHVLLGFSGIMHRPNASGAKTK
jgi:hypothetical protein